MGGRNLYAIKKFKDFISNPQILRRTRLIVGRSAVSIKNILSLNWIPRSLSYYVNIQKNKMLNLNRRKRLMDYYRQHSKGAAIFLTSKWSFIAVILLLSLYFIFPIDRTIYAATPVLGWNDNYYLTLWQVYGAIVGLSFVALFFSYEAFFSRVTSNFKNLEFRFRREFYQKTLVQPLLFFNLFSVSSFREGRFKASI